MWTQAITPNQASGTRSHLGAVGSLLAVAALALLAACGGGGGGGTGGSAPTTYVISGAITSAVSGTAVANATVTLTGTATASTATDGTGHYSFSGLAAGAYTVAATLPSASISPTSRAVTLSGASATNQDFAALRAWVVASGIKFLPDLFSSADQLRASLVVRAGYAYFSDSSDFPIKRAALSGIGTAALAPRFTGARSVVLHGQNLYWVDGGRLNKRPLDSGSITVLATGSSDHGDQVTADIVVDETYAYWVNTVSTPNCSPPCTWIIQKVALNGGTPVTLATVNRKVAALTSDADRLYWEEASSEPVSTGCQCGSTIKSIPKAGGTPTLLVDALLNGAAPAPPPGHIAGSWYPTGGLAVTATEVLFAAAGYQVLAVPLSGGSVRTLATVNSGAGLASNAIRGLSVSGTNAYWIDCANQTLATVPITGGTVTELATGLGVPADLNRPVSLAINATSAFWTEPGGPVGCCLRIGTGVIKRVALSGGAVSTVLSGLDAPAALAVDALNVVWAETWRVGKAPLGGGSVTTLASGIASNLACIAVDQTNLYTLDGDYIKKVPLAGGTVEVLASARLGSINDLSLTNQDIATDGTHVYWTIKSTIGPPLLQKVPVAGGTPVTLVAEATIANPQDCRWRIAVDAQNVYWSASGTSGPISGAVKKVPISGGTVTTLVDYPYLMDFTIDGTSVYFSEFGSSPGSIRKAPLSGGTSTSVLASTAAWVLSNDPARLYWIDLQHSMIGWLAKTAAAGTAAALLPGTLLLDPRSAFEELTLDGGFIYITETQTGSIYSVY